jgi:cell division protein FtsQ
LVTLAVLTAVLTTASRFWPTVATIEVRGDGHYSRADIVALADVAAGDPLLWVTQWRVRGLANDPWVLQANVTRVWPDHLRIDVWERTPLARPAGVRPAFVWSEDGRRLPGPPSDVWTDLPVVDGWGRDRTAEALELLLLLKSRGVEVIEYGPEGFEIAMGNASVFTPSLEALRRHWAAVQSHDAGRLAVYPWGVSHKE